LYIIIFTFLVGEETYSEINYSSQQMKTHNAHGPLHYSIKVKLTLCLTKYHSFKSYRGSGCTAPRILNLGTRWIRVISVTAWFLYLQGRSPLSGPQVWSKSGRKENIASAWN